MEKELNIIVIQKKFPINVRESINYLRSYIGKLKINDPTIVVLHELTFTKYFCISKNKKNFLKAISGKSFILNEIKDICKEYKVFILFSYFEKKGRNYYNTSSLISKNGTILGKYQKKNLPNELCYHEKFYFKSTNKPFKSFNIGICKIGIMLCWDQWYANSYSELCMSGSDIILCPTSIGNTYVKKKKLTLANEKKMWKSVIQSNSLMNNIPVVIANRIGKESTANRSISFWGSSFITNADGVTIAESSGKEGFLRAKIDLSYRRKSIKKWGFHRK